LKLHIQALANHGSNLGRLCGQDCGQHAFDLRILVRSNEVMKLVPAFGRMIPTTPTPKARGPKTNIERFDLREDGIDLGALAASSKRRAAPSAAPTVFGERAAMLLPLMGLAACGGGGVSNPPGPPPAPPAPALTVATDTSTYTVGGALAGVTNVLANDAPATGTTVSAVAAGATAGTGGVGAAVAGALGSLTISSTGAASYAANSTTAVALAAGATGTDTFTYTASNSSASPTSASTQITITVTGINDAPNAQADKTIALAAGATTTALAITAVTDPDTTDVLRISAFTVPTAGQLLKADNSVVTASTALTVADLTGLKFNPTGVAAGSYTFSYTVSDRAAGVTGALTDIQTITLTVAAPPPPAGPTIVLGAGVAGVVAFTGAASSGFGASIAGGVDINGDGSRDFVVGAPNAGAGSVSVFSTNGAGGTATVLNGLTAGDRFGTSIALSATSIGGSATADLIVGAPGATGGTGIGDGRVFIIYGQGTLAVPDPAGFGTTNGFVFNGQEAGNNFTGTPTGGNTTNYGANAGYVVAAVGDVNGDGRGDFVIGYPGQEGTAAGLSVNNDAGAAELVFTAAAPSLINSIGSGAFLRGGVNESATPTAIAGSAGGAASFNGSGTVDVAFGDGLRDDGGAQRGYVYLRLDQTAIGNINAATNIATEQVTFRGAAAGDRLGASLAFGDVNGDGKADLIIGAPGADVNGTDSGAVYIVYGGTNTAVVTDLSTATFTGGVATINGLTVARIAGGAAGQGFGASVAFVGNFDGTGGDFAVGTNGGSGDAYVINGGAAAAVGTRNVTTPDGTNVTQLDGTGTGTVVVSGLGDINGGGLADVGVGIASSNSAFIVYGRGSGIVGNSVSFADTGLTYDSSTSVSSVIDHYAGASSAAVGVGAAVESFSLAMPLPALDHLQTLDFA
jgi:VCBS repeat-containing protein